MIHLLFNESTEPIETSEPGGEATDDSDSGAW